MRVALTAALVAVVQAVASQPLAVAESAERGATPLPLRDSAGREIGWYGGSHALLIGNSSYAQGWPQLEAIPRELAEVRAVLVEQGFAVEVVTNADGDRLRSAFKSFIDRHGYERDNRLLFYFAGHGFTRDRGGKAYLVPVDAPQPQADELGFLARALSMTQVLAWAREMEAKHAIFLFDSCFSGAIFKARSGPEAPPHINADLLRPVRQFITAGSAAERVPASSVFSPLLVRALRGAADLNEDGYVTGTELGMYLHDEVLAQHVGETPQFGKIRDPELDEGDFVFAVGKAPRVGLPATGERATPPPPPPRGQEDPFAACASVLTDFDDGSFALRPMHDHGQLVGERGMTAGEFKLSMELPRNLHKACVSCAGLAKAYRVVSKVRSGSSSGTRGLYVLDDRDHWYALELSSNGRASIKHYECMATDCAQVLWEGPYAVRAVDELSLDVLDGWIQARVNGVALPRQPFSRSSLGPVPLANGFIVTTEDAPPTAAYFDDFVLTTCNP